MSRKCLDMNKIYYGNTSCLKDRKKINACLSYNTHRCQAISLYMPTIHVNYAISEKSILVLSNREV